MTGIKVTRPEPIQAHDLPEKQVTLRSNPPYDRPLHHTATDRKAHTLGHAAIDADHFAIANWWMRVTQCEPIALPFHIAGLRRVMRDHFSHEATLVEAAGTPFCHCHRNEHNVLLELCDDALGLSARNLPAARALLRNKLPRLMRDHINCMDQIAVLVIRAAAEDPVTLQRRS